MVFSKPAYGEHQKSSAFILSVKRCRNKRTGEIKVFPEVIGIVTRIYRFGGMSLFVYDIQGMMDFQYGPFTKISSEGSTPKFKIFYDSLMLEGPSLSVDEYLSRDTPSYLPPMIFSRIDSVMPYNFAPRFRTSEYIKFEEKSQQMPYNRRARRTYGIFVGMNEPTPQSPNEEAIIRVNTGGDELMELSDELKRDEALITEEDATTNFIHNNCGID
ncbi:unnamed protein product [Protopolystoma xenopodis]|uniref:Transcription factor IIIC subunit 5 HTH domain-containing protein n=1 Tax=Protopolystoma xenopodis TaxID=117903 RepID=A0A3S5AQ72_9PLAT|nr:unnamed protein product [Protopolystoma xenopodis]